MMEQPIRPKQWCHVSNDINHDPEFRKFCEENGAGGIRFFLFALSMLNKTYNHWDLHTQWDMKFIAASCGSKPGLILRSYRSLIDLRWLSVGVDSCHRQFIFMRNWLKYQGTRQFENPETTAYILSYPNVYHKNDIQEVSASPPPLHAVSKIQKKESPSAPRKKTPSAEPKKPKPTAETLEIQIEAMLEVTPWRNEREEPAFLRLWETWPRKDKFLEAKLAWLQMRPTGEDAGVMLSQVAKKTKGNGEWAGEDKKFCPQLSKYLYEKRWMDGV